MTFCEKADMQKMMTVLQFWLFLLIQGSRKRVPKTGERGTLKKDTQMVEKLSLGGPIWKAVGCLFGIVFGFFISVAPDGVQVAPDISSFLSFALTIFFAFGIAFEIPIAVFLSIWADLAEPDTLSEKRPYVVVGCFVIAMLLTPPDPFTQSMLALPMWALFELGILAGRFIRKKQNQEDPA